MSVYLSWGLTNYLLGFCILSFSVLVFLFAYLYFWTDVSILSLIVSKIYTLWSRGVAKVDFCTPQNLPKAWIAFFNAFSSNRSFSKNFDFYFGSILSSLEMTCWQDWATETACVNRFWL